MAEYELDAPESFWPQEKPFPDVHLEGTTPTAMPTVTPTQAIVEQAARPAARNLTPKRIGEFLEERMLPSIDDEQQKAKIAQEQRRAVNEATVPGVSDPMQKAVAATGSAMDTATFGVFPYIPAAMAKGAAKIGIPGYEQFAEPSITEIKKAIDTKQSAINELQPGWSLAGNVAGLGMGMKANPAIAPTRGPAVSGAATGAVYGGISGAAHDADLIDGVKGAVMGLVGGAVAAPILERTASGLTRMIAGGKPVVTPNGDLTPEAIKTARQAGLTPGEIRTLSPQLRDVFERRGVTEPAAREARFAEVGIEPKRGMVTQDAAQLAKEQKFGDYTPQATQAAEHAIGATGGQPLSLRDSVEAAINRGSANAAQLKKQYEDAYRQAGSVQGAFDVPTISNVGDKILHSWSNNPDLLALRTNELAQKAATKLNSDLGTYLEAGNGMKVLNANFRAVEEARKGLNEHLSKATTNTERAAIRKMIDDYDNYIEGAINNGAFSGGTNVANEWRNARKLFSEYQGKFGIKKTGEESGTLFKSILDGSKTPEDVSNMMFSFAGSGNAEMKQQALKTYFQLRRALGHNSPELENIRKSYVQQIMTPTEASPKGFATAAARIDKFLNGNASSFSRSVLNNTDREALQRYATVMRQAGAKSPSEIKQDINKLTGMVEAGVPMIAAAANGAFQFLHPVIGGVVGMAAAIPGIKRTYNATDFAQRRAANLPPESVARPYRFPQSRTALPLGVNAAPDIDQNIQDLRQQRATGGAVNLNALAKAARKAVTTDTEQLLHTPDEHVVKALHVAGRSI